MAPLPVEFEPLVTDWITAAATAFAALGTIATFVTGLILLKKEASRDSERLDAERRKQARRVHGYAAWQEEARGPQGWVRAGYAYVIANNSDEPIYRIRLPREFVNTTTRYRMLEAGTRQIQPMTEEEVNGLDLADNWRAANPEVELPPIGANVFPIAFAFVDAGNVRWERGNDGSLREGPVRLMPNP
ncbi:hypothetical protein ACGFZK_08355 [Streptomyces sp. NPDC048257]|uniref:hypothetical protein n=1 Tax=Streptomyces sp. NPDC048257 TaxID=3365526 RepID=UPI00371BABED